MTKGEFLSYREQRLDCGSFALLVFVPFSSLDIDAIFTDSIFPSFVTTYFSITLGNYLIRGKDIAPSQEQGRLPLRLVAVNRRAGDPRWMRTQEAEEDHEADERGGNFTPAHQGNVARQPLPDNEDGLGIHG